MTQITFLIKRDGLQRLLDKVSAISPEKQTATFRGMWLEATKMVTKMLISAVSGKYLNRRTGALSKIQFKIDYRKITSRIGNRAISGNPVPYDAIQEFGGTIRPKRSKYLAIPIGKALTSAGVARFRPREIERNGYDRSACFRSKAGNLILWGMKDLKTKTKVVPLFVLKKSVTIKASRWMRNTIEEASPLVLNKMEEWMKKELEKP